MMGVRSYDYFTRMNLMQPFVTHLAPKIDIFIFYSFIVIYLSVYIYLSVCLSVCLSMQPSTETSIFHLVTFEREAWFKM